MFYLLNLNEGLYERKLFFFLVMVELFYECVEGDFWVIKNSLFFVVVSVYL